MKANKILISGASVAGPALAYWLNRYGFEVTIVERAPGIRPGGYAVDFRGPAMQVLEQMDLIDAIKKHETRSGKITIVNKNNKKLASMPDAFTSGELEIMRGDLAGVFYEATKNDTEYLFDNSITALQEDSDGVDVSFSNGETRRFDLLVGADGLHSNVRTLTFGEESRFMHHLNIYFAIFSTPNFMNLKDMAGLYYGTLGKRVGVFSAKEDTEARASFYFASPKLDYNYRDLAQQKEMIRSRFGNEQWQVPQLLKLMDEAPDFYFDSVSQIRMDRWSKGRVGLLGDAGYCASPMSGMGTSMAVVGAYILAGELQASAGDHLIAFKNYETKMRPLTTACQKLAEGAEWFVPQTTFKLWMSRQIWKILPHTPWKNMMIEMPLKAANAIVLPNYEQMGVLADTVY
ncbi:FAD-dependent monooxygenase [Mucilaginibacter rubeus]|uniref:FAD-dependent oxidoreductase n=1 Tax=Mucilaginibacter rubeus TaxID=2027860 RepID=A0A5C1I1D6_9SPHI|nr:FAD-dependent monooxygenase [Mucilaginibacter rubeus]QEM11011.1 FAD-dependent oxidoreductase [Mucilaginibacter rubeus]